MKKRAKKEEPRSKTYFYQYWTSCYGMPVFLVDNKNHYPSQTGATTGPKDGTGSPLGLE
jgi:hypothetical protein